MSELKCLEAMVGVQHTPAYVLDEEKLISNLEILKYVQEQSGCKILLAQKAFSMFRVYPLISEYLAGTTASGLYEARLGREEFPVRCMCSPLLISLRIFAKLSDTADHIVFNSLRSAGKFRSISAVRPERASD